MHSFHNLGNFWNEIMRPQKDTLLTLFLAFFGYVVEFDPSNDLFSKKRPSELPVCVGKIWPMRIDSRKSISTWISCRGKSALRCINSCLIINLTTFILNISRFNQKTFFKFLTLSGVIWIARSSGRFHWLFLGFQIDAIQSKSETRQCINMKTGLDGFHWFHMGLKVIFILTEFHGKCYFKKIFSTESFILGSQMHGAYTIHINNYLPFDVRYHVTFCLAVVVLDGLAYHYHKQIEDSYRVVVKSLR